MKIAFDVKGTLDGPKSEILIKLLHYLKSSGHDIVIWSSLYSYAADMADKLNLSGLVEVTTKGDKSNTNEDYFVDVAIDDDSSQTYLAAKRFIWVHEVPNDLQEAVKLI